MKRTNVVLDEKLVEKAMELSQAKSIKEVIHLALEQMVRRSSLTSSLQRLKGKLEWSGDLNKMRRSRIR